MAVQTSLLQHENERLREALINEKKRRQRGKQLLLEAPEQWAGGAVFWSPQKVQQARDRQEAKNLKEEEKQLKAKLLQEARLQRAAAKVVRDEEKAKKAEEKEQAALS
ncbi:hypothetical protein Alg130_12028, partial [Pyrenophora tritici-repentis]